MPVVEMNGAAADARHSGRTADFAGLRQVALQDPDAMERNVLLKIDADRRGASSARPRKLTIRMRRGSQERRGEDRVRRRCRGGRASQGLRRPIVVMSTVLRVYV